MAKDFDIQEYMTKGVERVVSDALRATLKNPRESAFMLRFASASKSASKKRKEAKKHGEHVPPFLIASITSECNLHCAGCYSRCTEATTDDDPTDQLTSKEWSDIFDEASDMGISFILLAGGEPLLRRDVIEAASKRQDILFPVFSNGTYIDDKYEKMFDKHRNLVPILSIEGDKDTTDDRRGDGIYDILIKNMNRFKKDGLIFGVSVTVTTQNLEEVISDGFLEELADKGCKAVIYVEYVPISDEAKELSISDEQREYLKDRMGKLREDIPEMVFIAFPGDEKSSGGCVAAGRGFFHINSHGDAEPCPFSPYSDINVRETSLRESVNSTFFKKLRDGNLLVDDHEGGCVLYEKREQVEAVLSGV